MKDSRKPPEVRIVGAPEVTFTDEQLRGARVAALRARLDGLARLAEHVEDRELDRLESELGALEASALKSRDKYTRARLCDWLATYGGALCVSPERERFAVLVLAELAAVAKINGVAYEWDVSIDADGTRTVNAAPELVEAIASALDRAPKDSEARFRAVAVALGIDGKRAGDLLNFLDKRAKRSA